MIHSRVSTLLLACVVLGLPASCSRNVADPEAIASTPPSIDDGAVSSYLDAATTQAPEAVPRTAHMPTSEHRLQAARALIIQQLRGTGDAQFRNERVLQDGQIVCMEVAVAAEEDKASPAFTKAVVITRPDRAPSVWVDRGHEVVAHIACELA